MLDLDALAACEERLSGRPAPVSARRAIVAAAAPAPDAAARCPHLAALASRELEGAE
jgi:hypothetical protein